MEQTGRYMLQQNEEQADSVVGKEMKLMTQYKLDIQTFNVVTSAIIYSLNLWLKTGFLPKVALVILALGLMITGETNVEDRKLKKP